MKLLIITIVFLMLVACGSDVTEPESREVSFFVATEDDEPTTFIITMDEGTFADTITTNQWTYSFIGYVGEYVDFSAEIADSTSTSQLVGHLAIDGEVISDAGPEDYFLLGIFVY